MKYFNVFECATYVFKRNMNNMFESSTLQGVYLQTLPHGLYEVLVLGEGNDPGTVRLRHIAFDEHRVPGAPYLSNEIGDGSTLDATYSSDDNITSTISGKFCVNCVEDVISDQ